MVERVWTATTLAAALTAAMAAATTVAMAAALAVPLTGGPPAEAPSSESTAAPFWSARGHDIVCEIAFQRLTPQARDLVFAVRAHDQNPTGTFYRSCSWPDSSRYEDHKATYEYHFMNVAVADAEDVVMGRDCANYDCVQLAIVRYARYLSTAAGSSESMQIRRANALKFLGHFVGDLHQPLHVGYAFDRGANDISVEFFDEGRQRLHAVWDFYIPDRMGLFDDPIATAHRLHGEISDSEASRWTNFDVVSWSRESYEVVKGLVYDFPENRVIDEAYFNRAAPIVEQRFKQAGVRLAHLINRAAAGTLQFPSMFAGS